MIHCEREVAPRSRFAKSLREGKKRSAKLGCEARREMLALGILASHPSFALRNFATSKCSIDSADPIEDIFERNNTRRNGEGVSRIGWIGGEIIETVWHSMEGKVSFGDRYA